MKFPYIAAALIFLYFFPQDSPVGPLDGRSAVEYFTKCLHTGKIKFMYFNHAPSRHYEPYNIISVAKNKVKFGGVIFLAAVIFFGSI